MSDIDIARAAKTERIERIGEKLGIPEDELLPYGRTKAKVSYDYLRSLEGRSDGKLVLVTALTPTPAGEGKTTTTVGLGDALNRIGTRTAICLREPSLGPCFGMKGGAAGGGHAQVVPMEDINLHFTGDFHAITSAHNLLAALIDNHIHWSNDLGFDTRRIAWNRVMDINDRALRQITVGRGGPANGFPREESFDITVASEVMAIFCLATDLADLERRLASIVIGYTRDLTPITAGDLQAEGPMAVLLRDALMPNLAQTLENNPTFVHGGPFANIAHGCNSVVATRAALKLADYTVTEAGFGADLGAEKFFNIKCRKAGLKPNCAVVVATVRALKMHGGAAKGELDKEDVAAVKAGCANLGRHVANVKGFGVPVVVGINRFHADTDAEIQAVLDYCAAHDTPAVTCTHYADGGAGAEALAHKVVELTEAGTDAFQPLYPDDQDLWEKVRTIATRLYGAKDIDADAKVRARFKELQEQGYGSFPICMAKTQYSFSADPTARGAPEGHVVPIREVRVSAGAGFLVVLAGGIMTMPGLPRRPAAMDIHLDDQGQVAGLF
ncbi:formate--tetrahydrofolate ligase [Rhodovibrio sodomensis]|uniref:Formate--tetrahydrofolate ligase n=1 Tax=Rhodovibrio sodomensis TaxID=1088 RepID=A0ABS1DG41_9PROT|nr:formate--tetrahydrofolate ligase [Rhodovibrio sodomensis]MBK1669077.1 formate--tetrahydrofolate ligase [Rhodovibrio sodomensis]